VREKGSQHSRYSNACLVGTLGFLPEHLLPKRSLMLLYNGGKAASSEKTLSVGCELLGRRSSRESAFPEGGNSLFDPGEPLAYITKPGGLCARQLCSLLPQPIA
jgi:hypothetical protein